MSDPKSKLPPPSDQPQSNSQSLMMLDIIKEARKTKINTTAKYRLLLAIYNQETLYENNIVIACNLTRNIAGLPDSTDQATIDGLAEQLVGMFNDTYLALVKDLESSKFANQALLEMSKGN